MGQVNKNQVMQDSTFTVVDDGDNTKVLAFQCSGITTGTTRTMTVPNSDGTLALTSDIVGATPLITWGTTFEYIISRYTATLIGVGTMLAQTTGMTADTSATINSGASLSATNAYGFDKNAFGGIGSSYFSVGLNETTTGTDNYFYFGIGPVDLVTGGINYNTNHDYGFKERRSASSSTWSVTNAQGTTETATSVGSNFDQVILNAQKNSTTDIKFYRDKTLIATHTTNLPTSTANGIAVPYIAISNAATATRSVRDFTSFNYSINAQ